MVFASHCSPLLLYLSLSAFISSQRCLACSFTMIISSACPPLTSTTTRLRPPSSRVPPRIRLEYAVRDGGKVNPADSRPDIPHRVDDVEIDIRPGLCGRQRRDRLTSIEQRANCAAYRAETKTSARSDKETHDIFSTSSIISDVTHRLHATNETRPGMALRPHRPPRCHPPRAVANPCPKCSAASCAYSPPARPTLCASAGGCPADRRATRSACAVAPA